MYSISLPSVFLKNYPRIFVPGKLRKGTALLHQIAVAQVRGHQMVGVDYKILVKTGKVVLLCFRQLVNAFVVQARFLSYRIFVNDIGEYFEAGIGHQNGMFKLG
jgi:hypothetical protein